ncbi:MAG TPA: hypothetical protein VK658_00080 [Chryseolinea sp.]|nr:hypothetical protein [Chryseolinea sp.]
MITNIALFITVMAYSVIVSQSFMYLLALRDTQLKMDATSYIQFRKLVDRNMQAKFRYITYAALLASLLLIPIAFADGSWSLITASLVAFGMLVFDTMITIKGNLPINNAINAWTENHYPANWQEIRARWLQFFQYRQILNIMGFAALVAGMIFR